MLVPGYANPGAKGNDSTFGGLTAVGGGGGAQNNWDILVEFQMQTQQDHIQAHR